MSILHNNYCPNPEDLVIEIFHKVNAKLKTENLNNYLNNRNCNIAFETFHNKLNVMINEFALSETKIISKNKEYSRITPAIRKSFLSLLRSYHQMIKNRLHAYQRKKALLLLWFPIGDYWHLLIWSRLWLRLTAQSVFYILVFDVQCVLKIIIFLFHTYSICICLHFYSNNQYWVVWPMVPY